METIIIELEPQKISAGCVDPHVLPISKANDAGKTITFSAKDSGFAVVIPRNSDEKFLFVENTGVVIHPWCCDIRPPKDKVTPQIKISSDLTVGDEWVYYVYCEKTQEWADVPDSSPPRIIVIP